MRMFTVFELLIIEESGDEGIDSPLVLYALVPIIPLSRFSRAREFPKPHKRLWSVEMWESLVTIFEQWRAWSITWPNNLDFFFQIF